MCFPTRGSRKKKKKWLTWQAWDSPCNPQRMCGRMGLNTAHRRCPWATASAKGAVKSAGESGREDSTAVGLEGPIAQELQENINLSLHAVLGTIENGRMAGLGEGCVTPSNFYFVAFPEPVCYAMLVFDVVGRVWWGFLAIKARVWTVDTPCICCLTSYPFVKHVPVRVMSRKRWNC